MCFGVKQLWKEEEHEFVHYWMMAIEVKEEDIYIQLVWDSCIPPFYGRVENQGNNFVSGELKGYMKRFVSKWKADRRRRSFVTDDYTSKWKKKRNEYIDSSNQFLCFTVDIGDREWRLMIDQFVVFECFEDWFHFGKVSSLLFRRDDDLCRVRLRCDGWGVSMRLDIIHYWSLNRRRVRTMLW